jgi:hypothetical protein
MYIREHKNAVYCTFSIIIIIIINDDFLSTLSLSLNTYKDFLSFFNAYKIFNWK